MFEDFKIILIFQILIKIFRMVVKFRVPTSGITYPICDSKELDLIILSVPIKQLHNILVVIAPSRISNKEVYIATQLT